jgi:hypothetical protein
MSTFYLGKKHANGRIFEIVEFEIKDEVAFVTSVPGRERHRLDIQLARNIWRELTGKGFVKIDVRVAIATSARIASHEAGLRDNPKRTSLIYGQVRMEPSWNYFDDPG